MESSSVLCRNRAAILLVLIAFAEICHAQMTQPDACETELANCRALLGAKVAKDVAQLAAVTAETGTPSSESEGARLRSSRRRFASLAQTAQHINAMTLRICARPTRAVQSRVRSSARTRAARCRRPTPRSIPS
jgi:hypothetical protein